MPWTDRTEVAAAEEAVVSSVPSPHHRVPVATRRTDSAACAGGARWVTLVAQQGGVVVVAASEWHCGGAAGRRDEGALWGRALWRTGQARARAGGQQRGRRAPLTGSAGISSSRGWRTGVVDAWTGPRSETRVAGLGRTGRRVERESRGGVRRARTCVFVWVTTARRRKPAFAIRDRVEVGKKRPRDSAFWLFFCS